MSFGYQVLGFGSGGVGVKYIVASGGDSCGTTGDYKWHKFTGSGTLTVSCAGNPAGSDTMDYMVVAGAGGSGKYYGGAGGAGGYRESSGAASGCYTVSPLGACVSALSVSCSPGSYPITVGGGGAEAPGPNPGAGSTGSPSTFSTITSAGGGYGIGSHPGAADQPAGSGGSGGGGSSGDPGCTGSRGGGAGNTPDTIPLTGQPQGQPGFTVTSAAIAGASGGALGAGVDRCGGAAATSSIDTTPTARAGGGAGGPCAAGSPGGGGGGAYSQNGTVNTGGAAGADGADGGSGIVIIRYKYQ